MFTLFNRDPEIFLGCTRFRLGGSSPIENAGEKRLSRFYKNRSISIPWRPVHRNRVCKFTSVSWRREILKIKGRLSRGGRSNEEEFVRLITKQRGTRN